MEVTFEEDLKNKISIINVKKLNIKVMNKELIKDANLVINSDNKYGLIGKNGSGKTTLIRSIIEKIIPSHLEPFNISQTLITGSHSVLDEIVSANAEYVAFKKREIELETNDNSDSDYDSEELYELRKKARENGLYSTITKAKRILGGLGFDAEMQKRSIENFSGGWKMRIALSKLLFIEPEFVLLDEPTNHLDICATQWLSNYLQSVKGTYVITSHNIDFLNNVVSNILEIDNLMLKSYKGNYDQYRKQKAIEFNVKLNEFKKKKTKMSKKDRKKFIPREYQVCIQFDAYKEKKKCTIQFDNVDFSYSEKNVLRSINFVCSDDDTIVLVGENGTGKSTFIKLLMGEIEPTSGTIIKNNNICFGYLSQNYDDILDPDLTAVQFIEKHFSLSEQEIRKNLSLSNLDSKLHHHQIGTLSGGEKTRLLFCYISLQQPNFIVFDEPTNNLDVQTIETLSELINNLECGIILVTHDTYLINSLDDYRLFFCHDGTVEEYDGYIADYIAEMHEDSQ